VHPGTTPLQLQVECSSIIAIRFERHKRSFVGFLRSEEGADCPGAPSHTAYALPRIAEPRMRASQKQTEAAQAALKLLCRRVLSTTDASVGPTLPRLLNGTRSSYPHLVNGSSVNRLGLSKFKSASVLSLRSSTLTRATFQHNGGSELKLLALWHCE